MAICSDYRGLYARHRGPYSLLLSRAETKRVKGQETAIKTTDRQRGPMSAEDAHETARMLISDPRDNVATVFVYSDTECQYIGAFYERGQEVPAWADARAADLAAAGLDNPWDDDSGDGPAGEVPDPGLEPTASSEAPPLLPAEREPVSGVDVPRASAEPPAKVRRPRVPAVSSGEGGDQEPAARSTVQPSRKGARLQLDLGNAERWPTSKGPALVRAWFEAEPGRQATVKDIEAALGAALTEAGVQFPKSLVSRLKQGGFLKETE